MKKVASCICMLGLAVGLSGQTSVSPMTTAATQQVKALDPAAPTKRFVFEARDVEVSPDGKRMSLNGAVQIRVDSTVMTADEAVIVFASPGEQSEIQLRGDVRVHAILK